MTFIPCLKTHCVLQAGHPPSLCRQCERIIQLSCLRYLWGRILWCLHPPVFLYQLCCESGNLDPGWMPPSWIKKQDDSCFSNAESCHIGFATFLFSWRSAKMKNNSEISVHSGFFYNHFFKVIFNSNFLIFLARWKILKFQNAYLMKSKLSVPIIFHNHLRDWFQFHNSQMCIPFECGEAGSTMYFFSMDFSTETGLIPLVGAAVSNSIGCPSVWKYEGSGCWSDGLLALHRNMAHTFNTTSLHVPKQLLE